VGALLLLSETADKSQTSGKYKHTKGEQIMKAVMHKIKLNIKLCGCYIFYISSFFS